jgi:1-deoxy-D-xylulose-5-phosphate reductoisomerase
MSSASGQRRVIVLGSTGSIGTQTLEVIEHLNRLHEAGRSQVRYQVVGLAAQRNAGLMGEQAARFAVRHTALSDAGSAAEFSGPDAAERLVREIDCDLVLAAISGAAGLPATMAAAELGRDVALANKETLVAAGELIVPVVQRSGSRLLPVDSEHSALWQCLAGAARDQAVAASGAAASQCIAGLSQAAAPPFALPPSVSRLILTASGGPFRTWTREQLEAATPEQALRHPVWDMGPKVTVDCASLTNKALEVMEAHWLFGAAGERIEVVIHPQSIVHSLVEYEDGSTMAQLGSPDMRGPIQYALTFPQRPAGLARRLDWRELRRLEFEPPDLERFPALGLAYRAIAAGGTAGAIFNAANEAAVEAFLAGRISFGRIPQLVRDAMDFVEVRALSALGDVMGADRSAREFVEVELGRT